MTSLPAAAPAVPRSNAELRALDVSHWQAVLNGPATESTIWMKAAADLGHAEAQAVLGQWLLDGHGVERDATQALRWFMRAAQQGHPMAMNMAGRCHEQGWGAAADAEAAAHWYQRAVGKGLPEARYNLANLLASGTGVERDHAAALTLYRAAAEQGYAKAYAKLGRYHEDGLGLPQDTAMAMRCYRRGAEGGDFRGQFCYAGLLAAQGRMAEALTWLEKVPATATPKYLREAGALLMQAPQPEFRAIGEKMLALAAG